LVFEDFSHNVLRGKKSFLFGSGVGKIWGDLPEGFLKDWSRTGRLLSFDLRRSAPPAFSQLAFKVKEERKVSERDFEA